MPEDKSQVSVEDLLRLKRAERPAPEFWSQFERELRQKQLTALVQKRRWWHEFPIWLTRRAYVPVGAAAVLTISLVAVRYSAPTSGPAAQSDDRSSVAVPVQKLVIEMLPATEIDVTGRSASPSEVPAGPAMNRTSHEAVEVARVDVDPTASVGLIPVPVATSEVESPSARSIAANLASLEQSEPELVNAVMGSRLSSPVRAQVASVTEGSEVEPARKYRLIARYAEHSVSPEPAAPALVRERIARRLGDDIGDRISRIGVEGSRVSLKF